MPLPADNSAWPPAPVRDAFELMTVHNAWYVGDPSNLAAHYGAQSTPASRPAQYAGGVVGTAARFWWGQPAPAGQQRTRVHIPLASDLASTAASVLVGDGITVKAPGTTPDSVTQVRIDRILNTAEVHAHLLDGAEVSSALGGVWLRCWWDSTLAEHVMLDVVDADRAIGTWTGPRLTAVTFWTDLAPTSGDENGGVWRHLEHHEPGRILHALYRGDRSNLGTRRPFEDHPDMAGYVTTVTLFADGEQGIETNVTGMTAAYVPNITPNRRFRNRPAMAQLGRSDLDGIEPMMDALDETWSSLQRDLRLGKGRITVPDSMLTSLGAGKGAIFDEDREVYSTVTALPSDTTGARYQMLNTQFDIRVEEHLRIADALVRECVKAAGYSPLTFGLVDEAAVTATEVEARERATAQTRGAKVLRWRAALGPFLRTLLDVDAAVFRTGVPTGEALDVDFPSGARESLHRRAETVYLLEQARAASTVTKVALLHPEWDAQRVQTEADAIGAADALADPMSVTPDQA